MKVHIGKYKKNGDRKVEVRIDDYDIWNADSTLALIILPLLKKLKEAKAGAPHVDNEDVPQHLHRVIVEDNYDGDDKWFDRWGYVLDEMIFAFESYTTDWEDQFWKSEPILDFNKRPEDEGKELIPVRWEQAGVFDSEGHKAYQNRISNGMRLFGKYYGGLWT